jgi:hypothetical protein
VMAGGRLDWNTIKNLKSLAQTQKIQVLHGHETKSRLGVVRKPRRDTLISSAKRRY